jgi:hypothetical protein
MLEVNTIHTFSAQSKLCFVRDRLSGKVDTGTTLSLLPHKSAAAATGSKLQSVKGQPIKTWNFVNMRMEFIGWERNQITWSYKPDHMVNRCNPDFRKKLEDNIFQCKKDMKDFAFRLGFKKSKTISTWGLDRKTGLAWADPVHLSAEGYSSLAKIVMEASTQVGLKRNSSKAEQPPAPKRPRGEPGGQRGQPAPSRGSQ